MTTIETTSGWRAFWARGGWWRAVLLAVAYIALYIGAGLLIGALFGDRIDGDDVLSSPESLFFGLTSGVLIGSLILAAFAASLGWFPRLFGRQPIGGRWWMWLAPLLTVGAIVLRLFGTDYAAYTAGVIATAFVTGLFIGFAEEVLCRGLVVTMLRDSGKSEWVVMVLSSLVFALLHSVNILGGQSLLKVALTVVFAFGFGACMYLTLRVTGNLIWPVLLHALYDPTQFLATGGIDETHSAEPSALLELAAPANMLYVVLGVVALLAVRGRVGRSTSDGLEHAAPAQR
ncbi:CPBP family intramembrane glutamic endopeptidase [Cellulomonas sp. GbtcB1]|uniref:CPBP family intramembrane glutamic endopeptidase n=1 Tax=Cellulomonas sp. GbtcB1 TaxID=2824746 RepID=UPI001C2F5CB4|nr:CPBP family intramembrane glutamic endopeptidase [Cellulomonas sp. GbtcB1]